MLSQKFKALAEGFVMGSAAATLLYTVLLNAGYIVSVAGAELIVDTKIKPLKDNVDSILLLSLESRMRDLSGEMCKVTDAGSRRVLQNEIDRMQAQHLEIAKVYYNITVSCS